MKEHDLERQAAEELRAAGFVVRQEIPAGGAGNRGLRADIIAWAPADNGELAPELVVEVKRIADSEVAKAAAMIPFYLPVFGARRGYVYNGKWHAVGDDGETVTATQCPQTERRVDQARAPFALVRDLVWEALDRARGTMTPEEGWRTLLGVLAGKTSEAPFVDPLLLRLATQPQNGPAIADALESALSRLNNSFVTPKSLDAAIARLLLPASDWKLIADPFCGYGSALRAVHEELGTGHSHIKLFGGELNAPVAEDARKLLALANVDATVVAGDSFSDLPARDADGVITNPPLGLRLSEPKPLASGGMTRDGTVLAIDTVLSTLKDGGRAVLLVAPAFLSAGTAASYRAELATRYRVVSVIEIGARVFQASAIHPVLLVLEKSKPTPTLVARLEGDWVAQLSRDGEFLKTYLAHLGGRR